MNCYFSIDFAAYDLIVYINVNDLTSTCTAVRIEYR
jgi:hypothetical protein